MTFKWTGPCALALGLMTLQAQAKPIAYADGWTLMGEYGAGTMNEVQLFRSPTPRESFGGGWIELKQEDGRFEHRVTYARLNTLVKRWNLPAAQANVFAWMGAGRATGSDFEGSSPAGNVGAQADYETRRVYSSLRSDFYRSGEFAHRIDTLQLGWAPYAHDWDRLATWIVVQARNYTGDIYDGIEPALVLRFFKGPVWFEIGGTPEGEVQTMLMFNW